MLATLLAAHTPADPTEAAHAASFVALLATNPYPIARTLFTPGHLTASAVVVSPAKELLLIFHPKLHNWMQPGGHIESSDPSPLAAAARELLEETGLDLPPTAFTLLDLDVHTIPESPKKNEPAHQHFDLRFLAIAPTRTLPPTAQDACQARWFTKAQLPEIHLDAGLHRILGKLGAAGLI